MKYLLLIGAATAVLAGGYAAAQDATLTIEPAHRTIIKNYVVKERIRPARVKESIAVGATVPADVSLEPVPSTLVTEVPEVRNYEYFDWDGKIVFVEPQTRKVVSIVD
jgi:hypothetical protein